jgi:hypothetical protein
MSPEETRNARTAPQAPEALPVTVSITRSVHRDRIPEATRWVQEGVNLANRYPGFLGSGWVRSHGSSDEWHMLYRFSDHDLLERWEASDERSEWLARGQDLVVESRVEKRTGIEGWFDSAEKGAPAVAPPRWKQATSIWVGFFPVNLLFNIVASLVFPAWGHLPILPKVLATTLILTPIMAYWVLPLATRILRPWLNAPRRA